MEGVTIGAWQEMSSGSSFRERVFTGASTACFFVSPVSSERTWKVCSQDHDKATMFLKTLIPSSTILFRLIKYEQLDQVFTLIMIKENYIPAMRSSHSLIKLANLDSSVAKDAPASNAALAVWYSSSFMHAILQQR